MAEPIGATTTKIPLLSNLLSAADDDNALEWSTIANDDELKIHFLGPKLQVK